MELSNQQLINGIQKGEIAAFEELYRRYYIFLCLLAEHIVRNPSDAEEIVSDVFVKLWNLRQKIDITTSIKGYLVKAVRNTSLNYLEKSKSKNRLTIQLSAADNEILAWESDYPLGQLFEKEIGSILEESVCKLPDGCREIFMLSRNQDLTYNDIACKLSISVNTVKTQMKIALSKLRENLKDYLKILLIIFWI
jgi:RNA polymerase sigma-70 factor, ECF subfamily